MPGLLFEVEFSFTFHLWLASNYDLPISASKAAGAAGVYLHTDPTDSFNWCI
jgi:hypothetical protein